GHSLGVGPSRYRDGLRHFRRQGKAHSMTERHGRDRPAPDPPLPDTIDTGDLDPTLRAELGSLPKERATTVGRHLAAALAVLDEDPDTAYAHALAARRRAGRLGGVREVMGLAAYRSGKYAEALSELRAARR